VKKLFLEMNKVEGSILRPIGAGIVIIIPVMLSLLTNNIAFAQYGVIGSFAYLSYQHISLSYNTKAIFFHGVSLTISFALGVFVNHNIWLLPFIVAFISALGYLTTKIYEIPKPGHFFIIMVFAMGISINVDIITNPTIIAYFLTGIIGSLICGIAISLIERLPITKKEIKAKKISLKERYHQTIKKNPETLINTLNFSFILFVAGYISYLLIDLNGYWVLISTASVLLGEELYLVKNRYKGRVLGSILGIAIGIILLSINLNLIGLIFLLIILNFLIEYFMPRNYTIANFFTNPLVLIFASITTNQLGIIIVESRFLGILIGSTLGFILLYIINFAMNQNMKNQVL
jgi:fusaric acid resistance family protein